MARLGLGFENYYTSVVVLAVEIEVRKSVRLGRKMVGTNRPSPHSDLLTATEAIPASLVQTRNKHATHGVTEPFGDCHSSFFLTIITMRLAALPLLAALVIASPYRADLTDYNLNVNQTAQSALDYVTSRSNTTYTPSPPNWRALPIYTILLDKFADGDPSNNDYFGTKYESDWRETQLRYGGDLKGLVSKLDYLAGMGVKVIFISGTPFVNMIWEADSTAAFPPLLSPSNSFSGYSPLDMSVLDPHWGTLDDWVNTIDAIHAHGMYIMADLTVGTMSDLIGFEGCVSFFLLIFAFPDRPSKIFKFKRPL